MFQQSPPSSGHLQTLIPTVTRTQLPKPHPQALIEAVIVSMVEATGEYGKSTMEVALHTQPATDPNATWWRCDKRRRWQWWNDFNSGTKEAEDSQSQRRSNHSHQTPPCRDANSDVMVAGDDLAVVVMILLALLLAGDGDRD